MSYNRPNLLERVEGLALARKGIRKNLSSTQIKAKLFEKIGNNREVEIIYYRALKKENISYTLIAN